MNYTHLLRNVSLFAQMNQDELDSLESYLALQNFHRSQILFQQGSITGALYIVKEGCVKVTVYGRNHEVTYIAEYGTGECFGEFALLDGLPRSAEAICTSPSSLLVLTRPAFFRFLDQHATCAIKLLVTVSRCMRFADAATEHRIQANPEQSMAHMLEEIAEHYGTEQPDGATRFGLRISSDDLASLTA